MNEIINRILIITNSKVNRSLKKKKINKKITATNGYVLCVISAVGHALM